MLGGPGEDGQGAHLLVVVQGGQNCKQGIVAVHALRDVILAEPVTLQRSAVTAGLRPRGRRDQSGGSDTAGERIIAQARRPPRSESALPRSPGPACWPGLGQAGPAGHVGQAGPAVVTALRRPRRTPAPP